MSEETVELTIGGTVVIPAKYAPVVALMSDTQKGVWQEVADSWIHMLRVTAAQAQMEVDDLLAKVMDEAAAEAAEAPDEASK